MEQPALWSGRWWGKVRSGEVKLPAQGDRGRAARQPSPAEPSAEMGAVLAALEDLSLRVEASNMDFVARAAQFEAALAQLRREQAQTAQRLDADRAPGEGHNGGDVAVLRDEMLGALQRVESRVDQGAADTARLAQTLEDSLRRANAARAETLGQLGVQIAHLAQHLSGRIDAVQQAAPPALAEPAAPSLVERTRQSEARTQQILQQARERVERLQARPPDEALHVQAPPPRVAAPAPVGELGLIDWDRRRPRRGRRARSLWIAGGAAAACLVVALAGYGVLHPQVLPRLTGAARAPAARAPT